MRHNRKTATVVGAGLAGCVVARKLWEAGFKVTVHEARNVIGGQIRVEEMNGVPYELYGPHIFHTDDDGVAAYVQRYATLHPYEHTVGTYLGDTLISWPPQVDELRGLEQWEKIERETARLPLIKDKTNFQTYALDVMGSELYWNLIHYYTYKQWDVEPFKLDASFAPKRIDFRTDGDRRLFRNKHQGWINGTQLTDGLLYNIPVVTGSKLHYRSPEVTGADVVVVTAPLDDFMGQNILHWRGQSFRHTFIRDVRGHMLPYPVVNEPRAGRDWIREYETKQMSGKRVHGTVVTREFPGAEERHYPVPDAKGKNRENHQALARLLKERLPNSYLCGRLANYVYIDMDQAVRQAINVSAQIVKEHK